MKKVLFAVLVLVSCTESSKTNYNFFPNLPLGEYRAYFKAFQFCNRSTADYDIQANLRLHKKSRNLTVLRGNITLNIPIDDSLHIKVNVAVKDSIGGWKDNALLYASPKACSTMKRMLGNEWSNALDNMEVKSKDCPIPRGVHVVNGYDTSNVALNANAPKVFFYGSYKIRLSFTDENDNEKNCSIFLIDVKRPWESE